MHLQMSPETATGLADNAKVISKKHKMPGKYFKHEIRVKVNLRDSEALIDQLI